MEKNLVLTKLYDKDFYVYDGSWHCVSNNIKNHGHWDQDQINLIKNFGGKNKLFIDVGTEIGSYSIPISDYFKKVISFEPNLDNFNLVIKNIELNNIKNIIPINKAISNTNSKGNMVGTYNTNLSEEGGELDVVTLDSEILKLGFAYSDIGFIKIDIEGHEMKALNGGKELIKTAFPAIYLETHGDQVKKECLDFLFNFGYVIEKNYNDIDFLLVKNGKN